MRAVVLQRHGGFDALQVGERPSPACGADLIRFTVKAAGVNFADTMARVGLYPDAPPLPSVLGYEVAGEVAEVGADVRGVAAGDRVIAGTRFGGYAEEAVVGAHDSVRLPDGMSFEQGAAVPVNYATAWAALVGTANVQAGERVLIHAAGGGVGIAATQLARHAGAEVWGTASPAKHDAIRAQGVGQAIDYTRRDGTAACRASTSSSTPSAGRRSSAATACCVRAAGWWPTARPAARSPSRSTPARSCRRAARSSASGWPTAWRGRRC